MKISLSQARFFGRFKEVGYKSEFSGSLPVESIHDYLVENKLGEREKILMYLKNGFLVTAGRSLHKDPLNDGLDILGGISHITDGCWLWTKFVPYFFEKYDLMLPSGFIRHIEVCNYTPPSFEREQIALILEEHKRLMTYSQ